MSYNNNHNNVPVSNLFPSLWNNPEELRHATTSCLIRVFLRMFAALLVTAFAAFAVANSQPMVDLIFGNMMVFYGLIILELAIVVGISAGINKLSVPAANALFFLYAIINGMTLSVIFLVYNLGIIYHAFAVSALMFGAMAIFGTVTKRDLTSIGSICIMGLFGVIIASVANFFFRSAALESAVLYIGILVFIGLTAYDTQRIKRMLADANAVSAVVAIEKISVIGALTLYLDFINLFLKVLRVLGRRR